MEKNRYRMVTCDLDGTLFGSDLHVSDENNAAIRRFCEKGIHFVPCTGRTLAEIKEIVENPDIRYIIYSGGAGIWDKKNNEYIHNGFPKESKEKIIEILSHYDFYTFFHADGKCFADNLVRGREGEYNIGKALYEPIEDIIISFDDFGQAVMEKEVECFSLFFKNDEEKQKCKDELLAEGRYQVTEPWPFNLEIYDKDAGKGNAIRQLAEKLGIDLSEVISIGDSSNDVTALEVAGLGVCVSNGSDELKAIADEIACSMEEHVADYVLKKYFT